MEYLRKEKKDNLMSGYDVIRYKVTYSEEHLDKIRKDIIDNCGERHYQEIELAKPSKMPDVNDLYLIRDVKVDGNHISRIEIKEPQLSKLIAAFLNDKLPDAERTKLLSYVYGSAQLQESDHKIKMESSKNALIDMLWLRINAAKNHGEKIDIDEFQTILDKLNQVQGEIKLNTDVDSKKQSDYIPVLKEAITLTKVSQIDYDSYQKVMEFTGKKVNL